MSSSFSKKVRAKLQTISPIRVKEWAMHIQHCLEELDGRQLFKEYLKEGNMTSYIHVVELWQKADKAIWDNELQELINEVDDIDCNEVMQIPDDRKYEYIKTECCQILEGIHSTFIQCVNE
ncbi:hypothetical protein GWI33_016663 [Rhynchophorus ferrugineus]|uniref:Uncharacterized protein n=1 Tax=Rhynchophorus ferrugineus TaxID=354439 RepID=A0A834HXM0_RHYFE|nr:hypothetical protein GWI33_016663 [Rhynchophorus ferrugineus]